MRELQPGQNYPIGGGRVVLTVKPGLPCGTTFGVFTAIRAWLADAAGQPLLLFPLPLASCSETATILTELYRHQGQSVPYNSPRRLRPATAVDPCWTAMARWWAWSAPS